LHPIGNFAADDRSPELQVGNLSTISSADSIFIHHVLLQGKNRHILGSALVRHTVPPCFYYIHFSSICQGKCIQLSGLLKSHHCVPRLPLKERKSPVPLLQALSLSFAAADGKF